MIWKLDHNFPKIHKELSQISDQLEQVPKKYEYNNNYERKVITSFYEMYERPDFKEKFLNLIEGLDPEDVEEIVKILQRQRLVKDTRTPGTAQTRNRSGSFPSDRCEGRF